MNKNNLICSNNSLLIVKKILINSDEKKIPAHVIYTRPTLAYHLEKRPIEKLEEFVDGIDEIILRITEKTKPITFIVQENDLLTIPYFFENKQPEKAKIVFRSDFYNPIQIDITVFHCQSKGAYKGKTFYIDYLPAEKDEIAKLELIKFH